MNQEEVESKREEFLALWNDVASIPRPRRHYSTLSNPTFAGIQFIRRLMEIQAFFMAHSRGTGKLPATKKDIDHILLESLMPLSPTNLAAIYCGCANAAIVGLLLDLKIEELFIAAELERRIADKRIGTVLIVAPFFEGSKPIEKWQWLTKELGVEKIKYRGRDRAKEDHDIRTDSVMRALEIAANLEASSYEPGPIPMFPLEMHPPEASFWNIWLGKVWRKGHETLRRGLIPVLSGDAEHISKGIVNYRDTERKKARNQWETLHGINQSPANESDLSRKIHPDTEAIHAEVNSKISTPEDSMAEREIGKEAYDYALSRLREDGTKFLDELIASGGNVSLASKAVGKSRQTGHKWKKEIKIFLRTKNLTK